MLLARSFYIFVEYVYVSENIAYIIMDLVDFVRRWCYLCPKGLGHFRIYSTQSCAHVDSDNAQGFDNEWPGLTLDYLFFDNKTIIDGIRKVV